MDKGMMSRWRVGVDSGGTFTDICLFEESEGRVEVWKVPSTPDDPSRGIAQGVDEGLRRVASNLPLAEAMAHRQVNVDEVWITSIEGETGGD